MNAKPYYIIVLPIIFAVLLGGCEKGNGVLVTQTFELEEFDKVAVRRHGDIYITQGSPQSVSIEAEENLMDLITTEVVDGEWRVDFKKSVSEYIGLTIHITMPNVRSLKIIEGSGGDIYMENTIVTDNLMLELSGDGTVSGDVQVADKLTTLLSGSGILTVTGTSAQHEANNSGAGSITANGLVANTGSATVSSTGDASVQFTGPWSATVTGTGNIRYRGNPPTTVDTSGGGSVILVP